MLGDDSIGFIKRNCPLCPDDRIISEQQRANSIYVHVPRFAYEIPSNFMRRTEAGHNLVERISHIDLAIGRIIPGNMKPMFISQPGCDQEQDYDDDGTTSNQNSISGFRILRHPLQS